MALEEVLTVAETIMRTDSEITKNQPGYYATIEEKRVAKTSETDIITQKKGEQTKTISREKALEYKQEDVNTLKKRRIKTVGESAYAHIKRLFPKLRINAIKRYNVKAIDRYNEIKGGKNGN